MIVETTSTGIALLCSKLLPYVFVLSLSAWTLVYGEREKMKAEREATASQDASTSANVSTSTGAPPVPPGH